MIRIFCAEMLEIFWRMNVCRIFIKESSSWTMMNDESHIFVRLSILSWGLMKMFVIFIIRFNCTFKKNLITCTIQIRIMRSKSDSTEKSIFHWTNIGQLSATCANIWTIRNDMKTMLHLYDFYEPNMHYALPYLILRNVS